MNGPRVLALRLCRVMCGRSLTFRGASLFFPRGYAPNNRERRLLAIRWGVAPTNLSSA